MLSFKDWWVRAWRGRSFSITHGRGPQEFSSCRGADAWDHWGGCFGPKDQKEGFAPMAQVSSLPRVLPRCPHHQWVPRHLLQKLHLQVFLRGPEQRELPEVWDSPWGAACRDDYLWPDYLKDSWPTLSSIQVKRCRGHQRDVSDLCRDQPAA